MQLPARPITNSQLTVELETYLGELLFDHLRLGDEKDALILQQQQQINDIMQRLQALEKQSGVSKTANSNAAGIAFLAQNVPNPFRGSTVISYSLPKVPGSVKINVMDAQGRTVKTITLNNDRSGKVTINSNELTSGNYFYELIVDGKKYGNKQMTVIK